MAAVFRIDRCRWRGNAMRVGFPPVLPVTLCPEFEVPTSSVLSSGRV